jgi:hypothetical protein
VKGAKTTAVQDDLDCTEKPNLEPRWQFATDCDYHDATRV